MATVIDSLIVEIGLDPKNFTAEQRRVLENFRRGRDEASRTAKSFSEAGKAVAEQFSYLQAKAIGVFSLFVGGRGVKEFVSWQTQISAETGRTSRVIGTNVEKLSQWRNVASVTGGTAEGMTQSISGLVQQFQMFSLTGEGSFIPWFRALGVEVSDKSGKMRDFDQIMLDLAGKFEKLAPEKAAAFGRALGFDEGTINLLIKGRAAVSALLEENKKLGFVTKQDADVAEQSLKVWREMEQVTSSLGRTLLTELGPGFNSVLKGLNEFLTLGGAAGDELKKRQESRLRRFGPQKTYEQLNPPAPADALDNSWFGQLQRRLYPQRTDSLNKHMTGNKFTQSDVDQLVAMGWSREQAIGIAANIHQESGGEAHIVGDKGTAYGLAQWHKDRQDDFRNFAGKDIHDSTRDEQLRFIDHELRNKERAAGEALRNARTAAEAAGVVSKLYERPLATDEEVAHRGRIANSIQRTLAGNDAIRLPGAAQAGATSGASVRGGDTTSTHNETNVGTVVVHTKATDGEGTAKAFANVLRSNGLVSQANSGPQ